MKFFPSDLLNKIFRKKAGRSMGLEPTTNGTTNHYSNQLS